MAQVTIYGASDDLIEVDGDLSEEFSLPGDDKAILAFGDGSVLAVNYDEFGVWRIHRILTGSALYEHDEDPGNDESRYSDRVTLTGDLRWVLCAPDDETKLHKIEAKASV